MKKKLYVAYGSNLNMGQMQSRCPYARKVGTAEIEGYELLFKGSKTGAYLTIEPAEGGVVPVGVFEVTEFDENRLDAYEGYPLFYYKKSMTLPVKDSAGNVSNREVFVYIMHEDRPLGVPSLSYIDTCAVGYRDFGFDYKHLVDAYNRSAKEVSYGRY